MDSDNNPIIQDIISVAWNGDNADSTNNEPVTTNLDYFQLTNDHIMFDLSTINATFTEVDPNDPTTTVTKHKEYQFSNEY